MERDDDEPVNEELEQVIEEATDGDQPVARREAMRADPDSDPQPQDGWQM